MNAMKLFTTCGIAAALTVGIAYAAPMQDSKKESKKEAAKVREERDKLERYLGGMKDMPKLPGAIFIVDLKKERIALLEARRLEIPVVAIVDTNCDPDEVDYVIPGNDDAIRAIKLISNKIAEAVLEIRPLEVEEEPEEEVEEPEELEGEEKPDVDELAELGVAEVAEEEALIGTEEETTA